MRRRRRKTVWVAKSFVSGIICVSVCSTLTTLLWRRELFPYHMWLQGLLRAGPFCCRSSRIFGSRGLGWCLRTGLCHKFLDNADAPCPGTTLWEPLIYSTEMFLSDGNSILIDRIPCNFLKNFLKQIKNKMHNVLWFEVAYLSEVWSTLQSVDSLTPMAGWEDMGTDAL